MLTNTKYRVSDNVLVRRIESEALILDLENGIYYGLDAIGSEILDLIEQGSSTQEIFEFLIRQYEVDKNTLEKDITSLSNSLMEVRIISTIGNDS